MRGGAVGLSFVLVAAATSVYARGVQLPIQDLVSKTSFAVVARLDGVQEWSDGKTDFGEGVLVIESVLFGDPPDTTALRFSWTDLTGYICPRLGHAKRAGVRGLWFLTVDEDGMTHADHSMRFVSLDDPKEVDAYLRWVTRESSKSVMSDVRYHAITSFLKRTLE